MEIDAMKPCQVQACWQLLEEARLVGQMKHNHLCFYFYST